MDKKDKKVDVKIVESKGGDSLVKDFLSDFAKTVMGPIFKKGAATMLKTAVDWIFGDSKGSSPSISSRNNYVSFIDYHREGSQRERYERSRSLRLDNFVFSNKSDAEDVLDALSDIINTYRFASINDLYDLCNKSCPYTGSEYGWRSSADFSCHYDSNLDGYVLDLPRAKPRR